MTKQNEIMAHRHLLRNGKYYVDPPNDDPDIKELLRRLAAAGAGREVDAEGFPPGPWTPEQLAGAISEIGENRSGIELRTVQLWFQDNQKGISAQNIRWLARIFGCGDPHATAQWQIALTAAQARMTSKRREKRTPRPEPERSVDREPVPDAIIDAGAYNRRKLSAALRTDAIFKGPSLTLPIIVWVCCGTLWFVAYAADIHDITYEVSGALTKQVGFFWSPSWILGEMIVLPIVLLAVSDLHKAWTGNFRNTLKDHSDGTSQTWEDRVVEYSLPFKLILAVCVVGIFILQWVAVYLIPFISGKTDSAMIDWLLVALKRPDVISAPTASVVSFFAFLYSGLIYWLYFSALLLLYIITSDFSDLTEERVRRKVYSTVDFAIAERILFVLFRCAILGALIAISIKVHAAFLVSDGEIITIWLVQDALYPFSGREEPWRWLYDDASPFFTSFLLLLLTCSVFVMCASRLLQPLARQDMHSNNTEVLRRKLRFKLYKMIGLIGVLAVGYLVTGRFYGFSIVVFVSIVAGVLSLSWKPRISIEDTHGDERSSAS